MNSFLKANFRYYKVVYDNDILVEVELFNDNLKGTVEATQ